MNIISKVKQNRNAAKELENKSLINYYYKTTLISPAKKNEVFQFNDLGKTWFGVFGVQLYLDDKVAEEVKKNLSWAQKNWYVYSLEVCVQRRENDSKLESHADIAKRCVQLLSLFTGCFFDVIDSNDWGERREHSDSPQISFAQIQSEKEYVNNKYILNSDTNNSEEPYCSQSFKRYLNAYYSLDSLLLMWKEKKQFEKVLSMFWTGIKLINDSYYSAGYLYILSAIETLYHCSIPGDKKIISQEDILDFFEQYIIDSEGEGEEQIYNYLNFHQEYLKGNLLSNDYSYAYGYCCCDNTEYGENFSIIDTARVVVLNWLISQDKKYFASIGGKESFVKLPENKTNEPPFASTDSNEFQWISDEKMNLFQ